MNTFEHYQTDIDDAFLSFDLTEIMGRNFRVNLGKFLIAQRDDNNNLSEEEVTYLLEAVASWRQTLWSAYVEVKKMKEMEEEQFEMKYAGWEKEARDDIWSDRELMTGKKLTSSTLSVSKEEIKNWILRNYGSVYANATAEVRKLKDAERLLYGTHSNLVSRGMELQSLLKGKQQKMYGNLYLREEMKEYGVMH